MQQWHLQQTEANNDERRRQWEDKMSNWECICWLRSKDSHLNSMGLQTSVSLHPGIHLFAAQVKMCPEDWWAAWLWCLEAVSGSNTLVKNVSDLLENTSCRGTYHTSSDFVSCGQELEWAWRNMVGSVTKEKLFMTPKKICPRTPSNNRGRDCGGLSIKDWQVEVRIGDRLVNTKSGAYGLW